MTEWLLEEVQWLESNYWLWTKWVIWELWAAIWENLNDKSQDKLNIELFKKILIDQNFDPNLIDEIISNAANQWRWLTLYSFLKLVKTIWKKEVDLLVNVDWYLSLWEFINKDLVKSIKLIWKNNWE